MIRVQVSCVQNISLLLWLGLLNAAVWAWITAVPIISAQTDRIEQLDDRLRASETTIAVIASRLDTLTASVQDVRSQIDTLLKALLGLFITLVGALVATLWSIRQGWLISTQKGGP